MKNLLVLVPILALTVSACIPAFPQQTTPSPVDLQATALQMANTVAAQTIQALTMPMMLPTTPFPPLMTPTLVSTATRTATATPEASGTPTETATPEPSPTATLTPFLTDTPTKTPEPFVADTLPPDLPTSPLKLDNRSGKDVTLILYCTTVPKGYKTIIEYNFRASFRAEVPKGNCSYVAYVGGTKMTGYLDLTAPYKVTMTINANKIAIH